MAHHARELKNIWIYGVGGVGGYFGGKIAYRIGQKPGDPRRVFFIARGDHLCRIQQDGLMLNTSEGTFLCKPEIATDTLDGLPTPDLCLLCVKGYDLTAVVTSLVEKVREDTILLPLLNGIDIYERVRSVLKKGILLPACAYVGTHMEQPGTVTQGGAAGIILCGKDPECPDFDPQPVIDFFQEMQINFSWVPDPYPALWEKFIFIAGFGLVTAYSGRTLGAVAADPDLREMVKQIMSEIVSIGERRGVKLSKEIVATALGKAGNFPFEIKTSYQRDIEAKGSRNEGDLLGGTIMRMGRETGIPTPVTDNVYQTIQGRLDKV
jgi:2-dehydropantoate 2-reductase